LRTCFVRNTTKQRILECATKLFAEKGYTETSVRQLAAVVGLKESSLYNHFPSKKAILEHILEDYATRVFERGKLSNLSENPTADGIISCMVLSFPEDKAASYLEKLYVILQEQHRNPVVREFVSKQIIRSGEEYFETIINKLKELNVLRPDTNPEFWIKMHSSLLYAFASRMLMGIGDSSPNYSGMNMFELMHEMCEMLLKTCGNEKR